MTLAGLVAGAVFLVPAPALAADAVITLTLDGRPVDRSGPAALLRHGVVYANAIDLTKSFDGFITLRRGGSAMITIGPNTGTFVPGSRRAVVNAVAVGLPAAPFVHRGDLFVPLDAFIARIAAARVNADLARHRADIRAGSDPR